VTHSKTQYIGKDWAFIDSGYMFIEKFNFIHEIVNPPFLSNIHPRYARWGIPLIAAF